MGNKKKYGDFFEEYLDRGFGKVKAADLEVMIFHWYMNKRRGSDEQLLSPFNISLDLSVPISKVKDLMYKESLMYEDYSVDILRKKVEKLNLKSVSFEGDGKWVFVITDKYLREYVVNLLQTNGYVVKSDFIRDNIIFDHGGFVALCNHVYEKPSKEKVINEFSSIVDLINECGIEVIKEKTQGLVSKPLVEVVKGLWNIIPIRKKPVQNII